MVREGTKAKLKALDATQNRSRVEEGKRRPGFGRVRVLQTKQPEGRGGGSAAMQSRRAGLLCSTGPRIPLVLSTRQARMCMDSGYMGVSVIVI